VKATIETPDEIYIAMALSRRKNILHCNRQMAGRQIGGHLCNWGVITLTWHGAAKWAGAESALTGKNV